MDGKPVTDIGGSAFSGNQLTSVTIGANVSMRDSFRNGFKTVYENSDSQAGTYVLRDVSWVKQ
jgi:hypothetical protein